MRFTKAAVLVLALSTSSSSSFLPRLGSRSLFARAQGDSCGIGLGSNLAESQMSSCSRPLKAAPAGEGGGVVLPDGIDGSLVEVMMASELVVIAKETGGRGGGDAAGE